MGLFDKLFNKPQEAAPAPKPAPAPAAEDWADQGTPQELQPAEVRARLAGDNPPVLLDVRNPHELQADGYIPGSVLIPMPEIEARWQELDPTKPTVVYCRSGMRSFDVGFFLIEKGFKDVSNLNGGILAWDGEIQRG